MCMCSKKCSSLQIIFHSNDNDMCKLASSPDLFYVKIGPGDEAMCKCIRSAHDVTVHTKMASVKARFQSIKLLKNEQLGIGSYGMVCKAVCDGLLCAAKLLHPTIASPRNSQNFDQECQVLSAIKYPNVIQYLGTHQDPETRQQVLIM